MRAPARVLAGALTAAVLFLGLTVVPAESEPGCPQPKTCPLYRLYTEATFPSDPDGRVIVPYWVNPTQPWVHEETAVRAIQASFATWEINVPRLRFVYQGTTTGVPGPVSDGQNVVGWGPAALQALAKPYVFEREGRVFEADIALNPWITTWNWFPCEQEDGACMDEGHDALKQWYVTEPYWPQPDHHGVLGITDIQNVTTHEIGHWLGLDDLLDEAASELTMYVNIGALAGTPVERKKNTLGLGDIVGARSLYPCSCGAPVVYDP